MMTRECHAREIADLLRATVKGTLAGVGKAALMFSGGLDSSVLAVLARKHTDLVAYAGGLNGSHDLEWAKTCANVMDLELVELVWSEDEVRSAADHLIETNALGRPEWLSTFAAHQLLLQGISEEAVITGMGADELFGGYAKYLRSPEPTERMREDTKALLANEMPALRSLADEHGKELIAPYLEPDVVDIACSIPLECMIGETGNKLALRDAARMLGVPDMMAARPKKAMQYGTGVSKVIRKRSRGPGRG